MARHGNSVNNTKAIQTKKIFERLSDAQVSNFQSFISIEVAVQELGGGFTRPPSVIVWVKITLGGRGLKKVLGQTWDHKIVRNYLPLG